MMMQTDTPAVGIAPPRLSILQERLRQLRNLPSAQIADDFFREQKQSPISHLAEKLEVVRRSFEDWAQTPFSELEKSRYFFVTNALETRKAALAGSFQARANPQFYEVWSTLFEKVASSSNDDDDDRNKTLRLFDSLWTLGWIQGPNSLLYGTLRTALLNVLSQQVKDMIKGDYETKFYDRVLELTHTVLQPLQLDSPETVADICATTFLHARTDTELFDIITSFPESSIAVDELALVLADHAERQATLARHCRTQLVRRLCHTGAETTAILDVYMDTIQVVRRLDPSDVLLKAVAEPVRAYLRGRHDTVRCILQSLTNQSLSLYRELRRGEPIDAALLETNTPPTMDWQPEPSLNKPVGAFLQGTKDGKDADILAMLVSIYGSKELFVNEYRLMLADKLLSSDYDTDQERHTLELLKLRFGESSMNSASVMIKDMDDSVRTHKIIRDQLPNTAVEPVIVSHIFWPTLQNDPLKHHPRIQALLDGYGTAYAQQKNPRQLRWMYPLGSVTLDVTVNGRTKEFSCSPLQATLLSHFEDVPSWTLAALSNETAIADNLLEKRMAFWISHNVVVQETDETKASSLQSYRLASTTDTAAQGQRPPAHYSEDSQTSVSASAAAEQCDSVLESYVAVMLTNLEAASWKKIHSMLQMMVHDDQVQYNKTVPQLQAFLQQLVRQDKLECGPDGLYRVVKKQQHHQQRR